MKKPEEILSELTGIPVYRILADDNGEYITKSGALQAMETYASQFKSEPGEKERLMDFIIEFQKQFLFKDYFGNWRISAAHQLQFNLIEELLEFIDNKDT